MKTKRPTPKKLPSGAWRCQVMVNGQRISVTDEDKNICQARAIAIQSGLMEKEEKKRAVTLAQAIDEYIASKSDVLSPSTISSYRIIQTHRFPDLMQRNVYDIKKNDVQRAINQAASTLSPKTISTAYGLVRSVLKWYGLTLSDVVLPQIIKKAPNFIQPDEIGKLIHYAQNDRCEIEILMALWLGMRRSEILGLCWDCVDFERYAILVRRVYIRGEAGQMILCDRAKTTKSQRTIACPEYIMEKLSALYAIRQDHEGRIFRIYPNTLTKHVHKVCQAAGITDTHTHGLRHTNAAVMRYLGVSDAHAMERGGWTNERTYKNTYSYVFENVTQDEDRIVNDFFQANT